MTVCRKGRAEECSLHTHAAGGEGGGEGRPAQTQIAHTLPEASLRQKALSSTPHAPGSHVLVQAVTLEFHYTGQIKKVSQPVLIIARTIVLWQVLS